MFKFILTYSWQILPPIPMCNTKTNEIIFRLFFQWSCSPITVPICLTRSFFCGWLNLIRKTLISNIKTVPIFWNYHRYLLLETFSSISNCKAQTYEAQFFSLSRDNYSHINLIILINILFYINDVSSS